MAAFPAPSDPEFALRSYFALLAGRAPSSHFLEVRYRVDDQQLRREFHRVYDDDSLIHAVRSRGSRTDVYVGCAPRSRRQGTKDAVSQVWVLWAECEGGVGATAAAHSPASVARHRLRIRLELSRLLAVDGAAHTASGGDGEPPVRACAERGPRVLRRV